MSISHRLFDSETLEIQMVVCHYDALLITHKTIKTWWIESDTYAVRAFHDHANGNIFRIESQQILDNTGRKEELNFMGFKRVSDDDNLYVSFYGTDNTKEMTIPQIVEYFLDTLGFVRV